MIAITITECRTDGRTWTHNARTDDEDLAVDRAIRRHWGQRAFFWQDSGLPRGYGQIMRPCGQSCSTSMTGRIRIDVAL